jgi:GWxTD domain-containing protein
MKKLALVFVLLPLLLAAGDPKYDLWLQNEGYYLLTSQQKDKFKTMTDQEKELFIQNLWNGLDPDPVTPENEFQIDYMKRLDYVKKHYGIPSDRAKIYLLLGAPNEVQSHTNDQSLYPLELWGYYSLGIRGLPPSLNLIFFKPWGAGNYRLYSPLFDGMKALTPSQMDFQNPKMAAQLKAIFDPEVVDAAREISVGTDTNESEEIRAHLQSNTIVEILQANRPSVETTIVYQEFESDVFVYYVPARDGVYRTSIDIAVPPKYLTFEKNEEGDTYQGRVDLSGKITDAQGHEIVHISDNPAMRMPASDFLQAQAFTFSYLYDVYLLPGKYTLSLLFRDYASNKAGKVEKSFEVKAVTGETELLSPLISYKVVSSKLEEAPFCYDWKLYYPKENSTFNNGQTIIFRALLLNPKKVPLQGDWHLEMNLLKGTDSILQTSETFPIDTGTADVPIIRKLTLESIPVDSYVVNLKLSRGAVTYSADVPIKVGQNPEQLGRVRVMPTKPMAPADYHTNVATQYYYVGNGDETGHHARIALDFAPSSYTAKSLLVRAQKLKGDTAGAIAAYEKLIVEMPTDSEGYFLIAKWSMEKEDWKTAEDNFKKAITAGYYTTELLNDLGQAQLKLGNKAEAVATWKKSLALDNHQPEIEKQIATYNQ